MNIIQTSFIRIAQVLSGLFFFFVVSGYFGLLMLLPLGILYHLTNLFSVMGVAGIIFSIPATAALFYYSYKIEGLYALILDTGIKLLKLTKTQLLAFEALLEKPKSELVEQNKVASSH